jgi:uncharacterized protein YdhG (YjbR/CyaY superfamily)
VSRAKPQTIDEYIAAFPPDVQKILEKIRLTIRKAAPRAQETISYGIPAFRSHGVLVYFAAFKQHIGFFPPVRGDAALTRAAARYAGAKGNLRFPYDAPIPYELIARITRLKVKQDLLKGSEPRKKRAVKRRVVRAK